MLCNRKQFEEWFLPHLGESNFAINSPHLSFMMNRLGYTSDGDVHDVVITDQCDKNIDTLDSYIDKLKDGGTLVGRFPKKYAMGIVKNNRNGTQSKFTDLNVNSITFDDSHCIVVCVREEYNHQTLIQYEDGSSRTIDINNIPILSQNVPKYYDYLESCSDFQYKRVNIRGSKNDLYNKIENTNTQNLVFVGRLSPGTWNIDDVRPNVSYEMFEVESTTQRDSFIDTLRSDTVVDLLSNLCYGEYIKLKSHHFKFIVHPNIFTL